MLTALPVYSLTCLTIHFNHQWPKKHWGLGYRNEMSLPSVQLIAVFLATHHPLPRTITTSSTGPPPFLPAPPFWCITPLTHFQSLLSPSFPGFILIWIHLFSIDLPLHPLLHWANTRTHTMCAQNWCMHSYRDKTAIYNSVVPKLLWRSICTLVRCPPVTPEIPHSACHRFHRQKA